MENGKLISPKWAKRFFKKEDLNKIHEAILTAEENSVGELVPVIVKSSIPLHGVTITCTLFLFALFGFLDLHYFSNNKSWSFSIAVLASLTLGPVLGNLNFVRRIVLSERDKESAVHQRAELEFYRLSVNRTEDRMGILIFVSLLEQSVVILADKGISVKLNQSAWQEIVNDTVHTIRTGQLGAGLVHSIQTCGKLLAQHFPHRIGKKSQLRNVLTFEEIR